MNYQEVKEKLEASKQELMTKMKNKELSKDEIDSIERAIENYNYIIELTDMNHFERGKVVN
jgi:predicted class III extradiol MEMO1 family dioxygenase